jgi:hypothetical protein
VPGAVEQLRYTWAPRGVEGVNRFQIAGMSAGFRTGEAAGALALARSLCRYDPPRGSDEERPVSFGWADQGPYRIAFQRLALPAGTDRAGNFAAHLLVGSPETLPAPGIAASFGSPLWWRGITPEERAEIAEGKRDFELPTIELEELTATAPVPDCEEEATIALLHRLLRLPARERLAISAKGETLAWVLSSVARLLPEALAGLTASTYEGKPVYPFRLLGASETVSQMRTCDLCLPDALEQGERRTLEELIAPGPASDELRRVVRRAGRGPGADTADRMWRTALMLVGLKGGRETSARPDDDLLADSEVTGFLARTSEGRTTLARWVQAGGAVLRGVKAAGERMEAACREALFVTLGDQYAAAADLRGSAAAVEAMGIAPAKSKVLDRLLETAREEKVAATLGPADAAMLVGWAAERGLEAATLRPMLRGCAAHVARCAAEPSVPDSYLATMFEIALGDRSVSPALAEAVRLRPGFLSSVSLEGAEAERCIELLSRFDPGTREAALGALLPLLIASPARDRVPALVMSLPPMAAGRALVARPEQLPPSETVNEICGVLGAVLLQQGEVGMARRVLELSRSADGVLAATLLRRLADGQGGGPATIAIETGGLRRAELRRAVRRLALDHARTEAGSLGAVEAHWDALATIFPYEDARIRLKRLLGLGSMPPPQPAAAAALAWIAGSLLDREPDLVTRLGSLRDDDLEAAAMTLAETVDPWRFAEATPYVDNASKRARKWWRRLEGQSEKSHRRRSSSTS